MTVQEAKQLLGRAKNIDMEINALMQKRDEAFVRATGRGAIRPSERVQTSCTNTAEKNMAEYAQYCVLVDRRVRDLYAVKNEIIDVINRIDDSVLRILLLERYINLKTWEDIADSLHYSRRWVIKSLHPKALKKVGEMLP